MKGVSGVRRMPKVSVIIPVYNAEAFLAECMDSLHKQTLEDCEFIFVDDGSADRSRAIIVGYQTKDARIRLISQRNQGVSAARNAGLAAAGGEYIGFVDADDWVAPDMYETLYNAASAGDYDVVFSDFNGEGPDGFEVNRCPFPEYAVLDREYIGQRILSMFLDSDRLNAVWNKLYRRELIEDNKVRFPEKIKLGEDNLFNLHALSACRQAVYIPYSGYYYREATGSATRNAANKDFFLNALEVYQTKLPAAYGGHLQEDKVRALQSVRFMRSIISAIHIYYSPLTALSFAEKYRYVKRMIGHTATIEALKLYEKQYRGQIGLYEKTILALIKLKSGLGLYGLTAYSRARNQYSLREK